MLGKERLPDDVKGRISLHAGDMLVGNIGASQHFEYRAVGDTEGGRGREVVGQARQLSRVFGRGLL